MPEASFRFEEGIGNGRQFPVAENFEIAVLHPDAVVAAASVLEHA